jgi:hypothetical protein
LIATLYPNAGYTGSEYAAHLTSASNSLTVTGNAQVKGLIKVDAGTVTVGTTDAPYTGTGALAYDSAAKTYQFYATLPDAITALNGSQSGGTITLLADVDLGTTTGTYRLDKNITIDGQGKYKVTANATTSLFELYNHNLQVAFRNLTINVTAVNANGDPTAEIATMGAIFMNVVKNTVVTIDNCNITSTNNIALRAQQRANGGFFITNSTIRGGTYGVYYDNSDHALNITSSTIYGGTYGIATNAGSSMDATITDSTISSIYLTGTAWAVLAGNTVVGNTDSAYAAHLTSGSNSLTVKDTAKIVGSVNVAAGTVNFSESKQIIRQNGNIYTFYDTVDAAFATALQDGEIVFSYNAELANGVAGYEISQHPNGYYEIKVASAAAA